MIRPNYMTLALIAALMGSPLVHSTHSFAQSTTQNSTAVKGDVKIDNVDFHKKQKGTKLADLEKEHANLVENITTEKNRIKLLSPLSEQASALNKFKGELNSLLSIYPPKKDGSPTKRRSSTQDALLEVEALIVDVNQKIANANKPAPVVVVPQVNPVIAPAVIPAVIPAPKTLSKQNLSCTDLDSFTFSFGPELRLSGDNAPDVCVKGLKIKEKEIVSTNSSGATSSFDNYLNPKATTTESLNLVANAKKYGITVEFKSLDYKTFAECVSAESAAPSKSLSSVKNTKILSSDLATVDFMEDGVLCNKAIETSALIEAKKVSSHVESKYNEDCLDCLKDFKKIPASSIFSPDALAKIDEKIKDLENKDNVKNAEKDATDIKDELVKLMSSTDGLSLEDAQDIMKRVADELAKNSSNKLLSNELEETIRNDLLKSLKTFRDSAITIASSETGGPVAGNYANLMRDSARMIADYSSAKKDVRLYKSESDKYSKFGIGRLQSYHAFKKVDPKAAAGIADFERFAQNEVLMAKQEQSRACMIQFTRDQQANCIEAGQRVLQIQYSMNQMLEEGKKGYAQTDSSGTGTSTSYDGYVNPAVTNGGTYNWFSPTLAPMVPGATTANPVVNATSGANPAVNGNFGYGTTYDQLLSQYSGANANNGMTNVPVLH
jgi:hypothetical protein